MATSEAPSASKNVTVVRKVNKLLDITVDESLNSSLRELDASGYPSDENSAKHRKQLRLSLEQRVMKLHEKFLEQFSVVREAYRSVAEEIETVSNCCDALDSALSQGRDERNTVLSTVGVLQEELKEAKESEHKVRQFMEQYQLTPEEQAALRGEVSPQFVAALLKTKQIHDSCRGMLSVEHQQAAVEVMETMYLTQVSAAEKLTRHLVPLTSEVLCQDVPHVTQFYVDAVQAIQDKPAQWAKVMHEVSRVRRVAVLRRFYDVASNNGLESRHPHEAPRFLSNVLAWLHQCVAEEDDVLSVFFPVDPPKQDAEELSKGAILDQIFEGLCKHLGDKIENTIAALGPQATRSSLFFADSTSSALTTLYRMEGLLRLYWEITGRLLGERASLTSLLNAKRLNTLRVFYDTLKDFAARMLTTNAVPSDFSVPPSFHDAMNTMKAMMDTLQSSTVPHSEREAEFAPVLGAVVDPLPAGIERIFAAEGAGFPNGARQIFTINLLACVRSTLAPYSFTAGKQRRLDEQVSEEIGHFVDTATHSLLRRLGLEEHAAAIEAGASVNPLALANTLHSFYSSVFNVGSLSIPLLENIQSFQLRESARSRITLSVCRAYDIIYATATADPAVAADETIAKNTPSQVKVVLEVDEARSS